MNQLIELDIIVRTLIGRLVELHGAENVADYLEHLAHQSEASELMDLSWPGFDLTEDVGRIRTASRSLAEFHPKRSIASRTCLGGRAHAISA